MTPGIEIGGDGIGNADDTWLAASLKRDQVFVRAGMEFSPDIQAFVQASWNRSESFSKFTNFGTNTTMTISTSNAFLSPAVQTQLSAGGATTFNMNRNFTDAPPEIVQSVTNSWAVTTGLEGIVGKYDWNVYYTHGETELFATTFNIDIAKLFAAVDAVRDPSGNIVCSVTLTHPGLYPGCAPFNPFGPTALNTPGSSFDYPRVFTDAILTNGMDNFGGTISGDLFELPAGPIRVALSGEFRSLTLTNETNYTPRDTVQNANSPACIGLRFNCSPTANTLRWYLTTTTPMDAKMNIAEGALEANVPVLKDALFAQDLSINGAVRYAGYSVSGEAATWKIGIDWHPVADVKVRTTRSRDIRAPTLFDLYQPVTAAPIQFADTAHTGIQGLTRTESQGNPSLVPEKADTWTVGFVYRPSWLPSFSLAVDYYDISMKDGITSIAANATTNQICESSGGTSPICAIFVRPLPFSNRTPANFPTLLRPQSLNVAQTWTNGVDAEASYNFGLPESIGGRVTLRTLISYQPTLNTISLPGQAVTPTMGFGGSSKWRISFSGNYTNGPFALDLRQRWKSSTTQSFNLRYAVPEISDAYYTDVSASWTFMNRNVTAFLSVQNLFDRQPSISVAPGIGSVAYAGLTGEDYIGRYFTAGIRMKLP